MLENINKTFFDAWGEPNFRCWVLEIIRRVYGDKSFIPGPAKGADGGIDAEYFPKKSIKPTCQIKWREIGSKDVSKTRSEILQSFKKEIKKQKSGYYLFITNISFTQKTHDKFKKIISQNKKLRIEYWEFERLCLYLRNYDDLYIKYSPYFSKEEVEEIKKQNQNIINKVQKKYIKNISKQEFREMQYKIKDLFVSKKIQTKFYLGFIYLLRPFYLDGRYSLVRQMLRRLFDITEAEEKKFISSLFRMKKINIISNLVSVNDAKEAVAVINEMLEFTEIPINKIIDSLIKT